MCEKVVVVTGFGPFGVHEINASWEAVKLLPDKISNVKIVKEEIPVVYTIVDEKIPQLWKEHQPILVIHVGVSEQANAITLETFANRTGYIKTDSEGNIHCTGTICEDGCDTLETMLNIEKICNYLNETVHIEACISINAGRYLCEYTFYRSLHIDRSRTLFVHVPVLNRPFSAVELSRALSLIIEKALEQL